MVLMRYTYIYLLFLFHDDFVFSISVMQKASIKSHIHHSFSASKDCLSYIQDRGNMLYTKYAFLH